MKCTRNYEEIYFELQLFGHISGSHINPALSVAAVILGEMSFPLALLYTVAQCSGATFAYSLTRVRTNVLTCTYV